MQANAAIAPRIEQRRFLVGDPPVMLAVKKIEGGLVTAEEQTRDASSGAAPRVVTMPEVRPDSMALLFTCVCHF